MPFIGVVLTPSMLGNSRVPLIPSFILLLSTTCLLIFLGI